MRIRQHIQRWRTYRSRFVAADVRTGHIWYCWLESIRGEECCGVVRGSEQARVLDAVVWDGPPGHTDHRVSRIGVPLMPLPAYRPELNHAERLFEAIRAELEEESYAELDARCARMDAILARWDAHPEQVRSLVGWHWILDALEQLPAPITS